MKRIFRLKNEKITYTSNIYDSMDAAKKDIEFDIEHLRTIQRHQEFYGNSFAIEEVIQYSFGEVKQSETPFLVDNNEVVYGDTKYYHEDMHFRNKHKQRKISKLLKKI